jgi:hypothetical protein
LLAPAGQPVERLDPDTRVRALAALAAVVLLGLAAIVVIWLVGRAARRYAKRTSSAATRRLGAGRREDDWARKPLSPRGGKEDRDR